MVLFDGEDEKGVRRERVNGGGFVSMWYCKCLLIGCWIKKWVTIIPLCAS